MVLQDNEVTSFANRYYADLFSYRGTRTSIVSHDSSSALF